MDSIGGMLLGKMPKAHHKTEVCNVLLEKANGFNGILREIIIISVIVSIGLLLFFVSVDISEGLPFFVPGVRCMSFLTNDHGERHT